MATHRKRKRGSQWQVLWKEPLVLTQPDGVQDRKWVQRSRTVPTEAIAKQIVAQVEAAAAVGERWRDKRNDAIATVRAVALGYVRALVDANAPLSTQHVRSYYAGSFLDFLDAREEGDPGAHTPVSVLSLSLLERYAASLPSEGRKADTRYRKVTEAERMW